MDEKSLNKILFPVFATTEMVTREAIHVGIASKEFIQGCARKLLSRWNEFINRSDFHLSHIDASEDELARWLFVVDTVNYSFWPDPGKPLWEIEYGGRKFSGYWGLSASLKRAYEDGIPITDSSFLATLSEDVLSGIFQGEGEIPLFRSRLDHLREAGQVLLKYFEGDVVKLIKLAEKSAERLVKLIVTYFPSFRDEAVYEGRRVFFWKRAQIFVFDLYSTFSGKGLGEFYDIDVLTAFADYKLPQVLRHLGILEYSEELSKTVDNRIMIKPGSLEEVEIRAATVQGVEFLRQEIENLSGVSQSIPAAKVDQFLWFLGQEDEFRSKPYHLCRTIFY